MKLCLSLYLVVLGVAHGTGVEDIARKMLRGSAAERVDIQARKMFIQELLRNLPSQKISQEQQDHLIKTIEEQIAKVQGSMAAIDSNEHEDADSYQKTVLV